MNIKPLADRVVVKLVEAEEKTKTGILLTASAQEKPQIAEVVAVGPGAYTEDGKLILPMEELESFCRTHKILMGIITVPADHAQEVCDKLIACGIKAIWTFAPVHLDVPENILVQNENMATSLAVLSMHLQAQIKEKK